MNEGVIKSVLILITEILIWSGWFDAFFSRYPIKRRYVYVFLSACLFSPWQWRLNEHLTLNAAGVITGAILLAFTLFFSRMVQAILITASLLLGSLVFLFLLVMTYDPVFQVAPNTFILPLGAALSGLILVRAWQERIWLSCASLFIGNSLFDWHQYHHFVSVTLFASAWQDQMWLSLYLTSILHLTLGLAAKPVKKMIFLMKRNMAR